MEANNKAMRKALKSLMDNLQIHAMMPCEQITMNRAEVCAMIEDCRAALAAPARNCDVGTAEEQNNRHGLWCVKHDVNGDMEADCANNACSQCIFKWGQMPYKEGESDGSK